MKAEIEVRKLNISIIDTIERVRVAGAIKMGCFLQKRYVYDFHPAKKGHWIRLRTNGNETTLAIKKIENNEVDGTKELEIAVSDFDDANRILNMLGFEPRGFQENFRIRFKLEESFIDIDKWPMIPPFVEIEAKSKETLHSILNILNINQQEVTTMDVDTLYKNKYGINLNEISQLFFSDKELKEIDNIKMILEMMHEDINK